MWSGAWKSIDELEENLTIDQLLSIVKQGRAKEDRLFKIILASAGADVDFDDEKKDDPNDIVDLDGGLAAREGFGIGFGLDYVIEE